MSGSAVLLSGGLDSAVAAWHRQADSGDLKLAVTVLYGQRHGTAELQAARGLARRLDVAHAVAQVIVPLPGNALTDPTVEVPDGHYADETMRATVVPNRNMTLIAVAAAAAQAQGLHTLLYGAHAGDHPIYPDCRPEFVDAAERAVRLGTGGQVELVAPYVYVDKAWIVARGIKLGVPLADTYSCYRGGPVHCGTCGTCSERREAFHLAGAHDPTPYLAGGAS